MKVPGIPPRRLEEICIRERNRRGSKNFRGMAKAHQPWGHSTHSHGVGTGPIYSHLVRRVLLWEDSWGRVGSFRMSLTYLCGNQTTTGVVMDRPDLPPCHVCVEKLYRNPPREWLDWAAQLHLTLEDA